MSSDEDLYVDYSKHKSILRDIFFPRDNRASIPRDTKEYDEIWQFIENYQRFKKKKYYQTKHDYHTGSSSKLTTSSGTAINFPSKYDKRDRINISMQSYRLEDYIRHRQGERLRRDDLSDAQLKNFEFILLLYVDFLQKQKFNKLMKIKRDREALPIHPYANEICSTLKRSRVVVIAGDTGCGKSTQVPQFLAAVGFTKVAVTQPRRIACISLAARVSYETLNEYGSHVGYQVRFEKSKTMATKILFLTEGLLLRQMQSDPYLSSYDVIILDEVHERHIHTDFLLGVLKCLVKMRKDIRLLLMSATINVELFSEYFDNCPIIKVPGRLYPIKLEYRPIKQIEQSSKSERLDPTPYLRLMQNIDQNFPESERGDLLIFLSGMSDIQAVVEAGRLYAQETKRWIVLPLHSALAVRDQDRVFDVAPEGVRKCIVSTNIAETSLTIDGVRFVADSGHVKEMSWESTTKMQRLKQFWISRASSEQRKGRAGRTGPGVCYRLYSDEDYAALAEFSSPEIQRVPLDSLVLQMVAMGLPDVRKFPFLEPPPATSLELSIKYLQEQGALTAREDLTPMGRLLSELPVDVVLGKMLILACAFHLVEPVLSLSAALSVQSPLSAPRSYTDREMIATRKDLESEHGDPFTMMNIFDEWIQIKADSRENSRKWCKRRGLEEQRLYEMVKLRSQFRDLLVQHGLLHLSVGRDGSGRQWRNPLFDERDEKRRGASAYQRRELGKARRQHRNATKRRKLLKFEDNDEGVEGVSSEEEEQGSRAGALADINDLEFRITHDLDSLQSASTGNRSLTIRDLSMLKIVLCSGLYPQLAIADDCNSYRRDSEQVFHTKAKGFILLHPNDVFASNPEVLRPSHDPPDKKKRKDDEDDEEDEKKEGGRSERAVLDADHKAGISSGHSLLAYLSILETNKPYLMHTLRVNALQTLLLYSREVDTNQDLTRIVFDGWLEVKLEKCEEAEHLLSSAIQLRKTLDSLLDLKLSEIKHQSFSREDESAGNYDNPESSSSRRHDNHERRSRGGDTNEESVVGQLERVLAYKLTDFVNSRARYSIRRILAAEYKHLYKGPGATSNTDDKESLSTDICPKNTVKGGSSLCEYVTYDCLQTDDVASVWGEYTAGIQRQWTCPNCRVDLLVTVVGRLQHQAACSAPPPLTDDIDPVETVAAEDEGNKEHHMCDKCGLRIVGSLLGALRHRKSCQGALAST